ncbi:MAG TPA: phage major capsid protein [Rhizomicrobium sp.]|jgi:HK97 family phage major capsid protein|nr:phage major capsid protein [Rhizomicrobium sp.]
MKYREFSRALHKLQPSSAYDPEVVTGFVELRDRAHYARDVQDSVFYRLGKWLQATVMSDADAARFCRENKLVMTKAQSEGLNDLGGFILPDELAEPIVAMRDAYGVIRRNARRWPLRFGGNSNVPRRSSGAKATWSTDGGSLGETAISFDSAALGMRKLGAMIKASIEFEEDAVGEWGMFVAEEFAWALAVAEDDAGINGDGTSVYAGIVGISTALTATSHAGKITAASGHNTFATLDATDISSLIGALPARALAGAKLFVSMSGYGNSLVRLASISGGLVAQVDENGDLRANYQGLPVVLTPSLPSSTASVTGKLMMVAGDMRQGVALGERRQITVRRLAERFAELDTVAFTVTERVDVNAHDLGDAQAAGALVGLFAP